MQSIWNSSLVSFSALWSFFFPLAPSPSSLVFLLFFLLLQASPQLPLNLPGTCLPLIPSKWKFLKTYHHLLCPCQLTISTTCCQNFLKCGKKCAPKIFPTYKPKMRVYNMFWPENMVCVNVLGLVKNFVLFLTNKMGHTFWDIFLL